MAITVAVSAFSCPEERRQLALSMALVRAAVKASVVATAAPARRCDRCPAPSPPMLIDSRSHRFCAAHPGASGHHGFVRAFEGQHIAGMRQCAVPFGQWLSDWRRQDYDPMASASLERLNNQISSGRSSI